MEGKIVTLDALLTQRDIADTFRKKGALLDAGQNEPSGTLPGVERLV